MTAERDSMTLNEISYPAPRDGRARTTPDPEVVAKPKRRQFTAQYRLRTLEEADRCIRRGESARCGSWPRRSAARNRLNATRWMRRCACSRQRWLAWNTSCTPRTRSWTCREK